MYRKLFSESTRFKFDVVMNVFPEADGPSTKMARPSRRCTGVEMYFKRIMQKSKSDPVQSKGP